MKKFFSTIAIAVSVFFSSIAFAAQDPFWEVGKTYLFIPRVDVVKIGTVTKVTNQEVVFKDNAALVASKEGGAAKAQATREFLDTPKAERDKLLEPSLLHDVEISYSRSEMTGILVE